MTIAPPLLVSGATRQALPFGLFSTFAFSGETAGHWQAGAQFETLTCEDAGVIGNWDCADAEGAPTTPGLPKALDSNTGTVGDADPFTVYGHFNCTPVGYTQEGGQARAEQHLAATEERAVENALWTGAAGNAPTLANGDSDIVTATGGGSPALGLALLENYNATHYGSLGVIHMSRGLALACYGARLLESKNGRLVTGVGTPVAAGAGYSGTSPTGTAPTGTTSWAYITPALFGYRSDVFTSSGKPGDLFDRAANDLYAVAERTYLIGFDPCGVGAALIDLTA